MNHAKDGEAEVSLGSKSKGYQPSRYRDPLLGGAVKPSAKNQSKAAESTVNENNFDLSSVSSSTSAPGTNAEEGMGGKSVPTAITKAALPSPVAEEGGNLHRPPTLDTAVKTPQKESMSQEKGLVKENVALLETTSPLEVQKPSDTLVPFSSASSSSSFPPPILPLPTPAHPAVLASPAPAQFSNVPSLSPSFASPKVQQAPSAVGQPRKNEDSATMNSYRQPVPTALQEKHDEAKKMEDEEDDAEESGLLRYLFPRLDPRFAHPDLSHMPLDDQLGGLLNKVVWDITLERPPNALEKFFAKFLLAPLMHRAHFMLMITAVVLSIAALPISQVDLEENGCFTYWGYKENCSDLDYTYRVANLPCSSTRTQLLIGSISAIINLFILLVLLGLVWYQVFVVDLLKAVTKNAERGTRMTSALEESTRSCSRTSILTRIIIVLTSLSIVIQIVSWAPIVSLRYSPPCIASTDTVNSPLMTYGPGFGISIFLFSARLASCSVAFFLFFFYF